MARSDLLITLVKASVGGDETKIRSTVEEIIADEKAKQHNILADRLANVLSSSGAKCRPLQPNGYDRRNRARDALVELSPQQRLDDLMLTDQAQRDVDLLVSQQNRASLLRSHGVDPIHRVMLVGPPGNGKTSLAEAIAESLAVPFFVVRYDALIGSYLGETAQRLKSVFDYIRTTPSVLFFDEFDAVGKERGDYNETGEIKRVVSSLLMRIDDLPSYTVVITASNHPELLDRAVWRRFQLRLTLPSPSTKELERFFERQLFKFDGYLGLSPATLAKRIGEVSYAEAEEFIMDLKRRQILSLHEKPLKTIVKEQFQSWAKRTCPIRISAETNENADDREALA